MASGTGMTGGTRITTDELSITTKNPTEQAPRYSLFRYLKMASSSEQAPGYSPS
ncbi:hypothetical protein GW918_00550 [Candidatus Berkelbacteria bacterium]|nr:hypothetical protein [Candidatus Berkelbacteria bacterium]